MSRVPSFHSVYDARLLPGMRVHHDNSECSLGLAIPIEDRMIGKGGATLCPECARLNPLGSNQDPTP
jgi:hypothetical protein